MYYIYYICDVYLKNKQYLSYNCIISFDFFIILAQIKSGYYPKKNYEKKIIIKLILNCSIESG